MAPPSDVQSGAFLKTPSNENVTAGADAGRSPECGGRVSSTTGARPDCIRGGPSLCSSRDGYSSSRVMTSERSESFQVTFRVSRPLKYMASLSLMSLRMVTRDRNWLSSTPWVSS
jgi:hypothetical protein